MCSLRIVFSIPMLVISYRIRTNGISFIPKDKTIIERWAVVGNRGKTIPRRCSSKTGLCVMMSKLLLPLTPWPASAAISSLSQPLPSSLETKDGITSARHRKKTKKYTTHQPELFDQSSKILKQHTNHFYTTWHVQRDTNPQQYNSS